MPNSRASLALSLGPSRKVFPKVYEVLLPAIWPVGSTWTSFLNLSPGVGDQNSTLGEILFDNIDYTKEKGMYK